MTVQELVEQVYLQTGELTNYNPFADTGDFDITSSGARRILNLLNAGQRATVTWKNGRKLFHWTGERIQVPLTRTVAQYEAQTGTTSDTIYTPTTFPATGEVGAFVVFGGEVRQIIEHTGGYIILDDELPGMEAEAEFTLTRGYLTIPAEQWWLSIDQAAVLPERAILVRAGNEELFIGPRPQYGAPSVFKRSGARIYLDAINEDLTRFMFAVTAGPAVLSEADQEPELDEQFHYALMLWASAQVYGAVQEHAMKDSLMREWHEFMTTTQDVLYLEDNQRVRTTGGII